MAIVRASRAALTDSPLVVFLVVGHRSRNETVVGSDEMIRCHQAARRPIQVRGIIRQDAKPGNENSPRRESRRVAVSPVPLRPQEAAWVAVRTHVPGLSNQLDLRD